MSDALLGVIIGGTIAILPPIVTLIFQTISENRKEKKKNKQLAYDKIIRYLYKLYNCNLKTTKLEDIYLLSEEVSVLATLHCSSNIQDKIKESGDIFNEYIKSTVKNNPKQTKEIKERLRLNNKTVRKLISKDMGNK